MKTTFIRYFKIMEPGPCLKIGNIILRQHLTHPKNQNWQTADNNHSLDSLQFSDVTCNISSELAKKRIMSIHVCSIILLNANISKFNRPHVISTFFLRPGGREQVPFPPQVKLLLTELTGAWKLRIWVRLNYIYHCGLL